MKRRELKKLHGMLERRLKAGGRGSVGRTERALGLGRGYFRKCRERNTIGFVTLLRALDVLGVDPCDFFHELFDCEPGGGQPASLPDRKRSRPILEANINRPEAAGLGEWLETMDERRYFDPEGAIRELWARIDEVEGGAVAPFLGVLASAYRSIGNTPEARECLELAETHAVDDLGFGDVLQRRTYLAIHAGDLDGALDRSEQAAGVFARAGAWLRFGETFVDQTQVFLHREDPGHARRSLALARAHVRPGAPGPPARLGRNLFALEQYAAGIRRLAGDLPAALRHARRAVELAPNPLVSGSAWALTGRLLRDLGRHPEAAEAFRRELALVAGSPLDALLATVDLVDSLARSRRSAEAVATAETVAGLLGRLDPSSPAKAAALRLWEQARAGRLRAAVVRATREAVERAQARPPGNDLGDRVRRLRRLTGLSRHQLAAATGVPADAVRRIEAGCGQNSEHSEALASWTRLARPERRFAGD